MNIKGIEFIVGNFSLLLSYRFVAMAWKPNGDALW